MKNKGIKMIIMVVLITMFGSCVVFGAEVPSDVRGTPCETAVSELIDLGIITGDTDGLFHPESELTRAQVCIMVAKSLEGAGINDMGYIQSGMKFKDMDGYNWAAGAIGFMAGKKMAKGYPDGNFRPGEKVTMAELITFAVRACGEEYQDENISGNWPENYIKTAKTLGLIGNGDTTNYQTLAATKSDAAIIIWKANQIIKQAVKEEEPAKEEKNYTEIENYRYGNIKFDKTLTHVSNMELSKNVVVYSYGKSSDYTKKMSVPAKSKLKTVDIKKYQNVSTKALYKVVNGNVTEIILPGDCGFSGKIYGVINSAELVDTEDGEAIDFSVLAAGKEFLWQTNENRVSNTLANEDSFIWEASRNGELFELTSKFGKITAINIGSDMIGKYHNELTKGSWTAVSKDAEEDYALIFEDGEEIEISSNAVVYIYNTKTGEYETASIADIYEDCYVRAYDITDDNEDSADIILAVEEI